MNYKMRNIDILKEANFQGEQNIDMNQITRKVFIKLSGENGSVTNFW